MEYIWILVLQLMNSAWPYLYGASFLQIQHAMVTRGMARHFRFISLLSLPRRTAPRCLYPESRILACQGIRDAKLWLVKPGEMYINSRALGRFYPHSKPFDRQWTGIHINMDVV